MFFLVNNIAFTEGLYEETATSKRLAFGEAET
jgi:hypothetical protein